MTSQIFPIFYTLMKDKSLGLDHTSSIMVTISELNFVYSTVKPVDNDHLRDLKFVVVFDKWPLFRGSFKL